VRRRRTDGRRRPAIGIGAARLAGAEDAERAPVPAVCVGRALHAAERRRAEAPATGACRARRRGSDAPAIAPRRGAAAVGARDRSSVARRRSGTAIDDHPLDGPAAPARVGDEGYRRHGGEGGEEAHGPSVTKAASTDNNFP
jgi:hypothetical protein